MVVAVHVPRLPLLVALLAAGRPMDRPVALGPPPGAPQVVGLCTPAAEAEGVEPGLRVGEALARCPSLDLVTPDPAAAADAAERVILRLEAIGARVEPGELGDACFEADGLRRLHGGLEGVLRRSRAALPVGAGGRVGAAPSRFAALQTAREAVAGRPLVIGPDEVAGSPTSACAPWARWRRCRGRRRSSAWARRGCTPGCWPAASPTGRCARAPRPSRSRPA
jgi:protein ImuB